MTGKEALQEALRFYIICGAGTPHDAERKTQIARTYLDEIQEMQEISKEWFDSRWSILSRAIRLEVESLNRRISSATPNCDMSNEREERRLLLAMQTLFRDLPELPL